MKVIHGEILNWVDHSIIRHRKVVHGVLLINAKVVVLPNTCCDSWAGSNSIASCQFITRVYSCLTSKLDSIFLTLLRNLVELVGKFFIFHHDTRIFSLPILERALEVLK